MLSPGVSRWPSDPPAAALASSVASHGCTKFQLCVSEPQPPIVKWG